MKYIITESRLDGSITNYLDKLFDVSNINWTNPERYDEDDDDYYEDNNRIQFYPGDYSYDEFYFMWYDCGYFYPESPAKDICPTVSLHDKYENILNSYFSNMWHEPFKKWFKYHFDLPVKTID